MTNIMKSLERPTVAVLLAAGRGRRLRPYTDDTPKPLLPVNGRPLLDYALSALRQTAVTDVCLVVHHLAAQIEAYVGDGSRWGLRARFRRQHVLRGSADALLAAEACLTAPAFIIASDYVYPTDFLANLQAAYETGGAALAVSLKHLSPAEMASRSSVRFDDYGRILEIVEKPVPGSAPSQIGASLAFIVPPEIRPYLERVQPSARGELELQSAINAMLRDGFAITGCLQPALPEWQPPRDGG